MSAPDCPLPEDRILGDYRIGNFIQRTDHCTLYEAISLAPLVQADHGNKFVFKYLNPQLGRSTMDAELDANSTLSYCPNAAIGFDFIDFGDSIGYFMVNHQRGDLFNYLFATNLTEANIAVMSQRILIALRHIHNLGYVHRDVKPENILLLGDDDLPDTYIADFGFTAYGPFTERCGTAGYEAPELVFGAPYGAPVDMWAFGVTLFVMQTRLMPFPDPARDREDFMYFIEVGDWNKEELWARGASDDFCDLIHGCLNPEPTRRLTAQQALSMPFYAQVHAPDVKTAVAGLNDALAFDMDEYAAV
jgi:serine/threonine protein kinase